MNIKQIAYAAAAVFTLATAPAMAGDITPTFAGAPTGWTTDRYDPASFADIGTFQNRAHVLGIGIDHSGDLGNRPAPYDDSFYNTQGKAHTVSLAEGAGSVLAANLYIPEEWRDGTANGNVRTDIWGVANTSGGSPTDYAILGFTNYGPGGARLRAWDGEIGWIDLAPAAAFGAWNSFAIEYTGSSYEYRVNGVLAYTDTTVDAATVGFGSVLMQAYNFADAILAPGANTTPYVAHWSDANAAVVPEPGSLALLGIGLLGFGAMRRKAKRGL